MRDSQLEKMSLKELTSLQGKIEAAVIEKRVSERHEMRANMEAIASREGGMFAILRSTTSTAGPID